MPIPFLRPGSNVTYSVKSPPSPHPYGEEAGLNFPSSEIQDYIYSTILSSKHAILFF